MNLNEFLEKTLAGLGYELADVERSPQGRVLRIFIDKPEKSGGVDIEDCVFVNHQMSRVLAVENVEYERLEISSPGLDRVLKKPSDFKRFSGSEIAVRLRLPLDGRRKFTGTLLAQARDDGKIRLLANTGEVEIDLENIDKARLVPKFEKSGERVEI